MLTPIALAPSFGFGDRLGLATSGHIAAAKYNITSNVTEKGNPPIYCVLHGFQIDDNFGLAS